MVANGGLALWYLPCDLDLDLGLFEFVANFNLVFGK